MKAYDIVFLGGIFTENFFRRYVSNSRGVVQNAADALQKGILAGLVESKSIVVINLPFIGSYPSLSDHRMIPESSERYGLYEVFGQPFANHRVFRLFSRTLAAFRGIYRYSRSDQVLLVYSAHLPFLVAAVAFKILRPNSTICLFLPDLPEHMGLQGALARTLGLIYFPLSRILIKRFDKVVGLTKFVKDRIGIDEDAFLVIEGIAHAPVVQLPVESTKVPSRKRKIVYSGTLARRYGIERLLLAIKSMVTEDFALIICGDGDARADVEALASIDERVIYLGQIPREEVIAWQCSADVLVNPRVTTGENDFTYFSFPSKIMEYLASGTPVVMNRLAGIPDEYEPYYIAPEDNSAESLARCLDRVCAMQSDERAKFGIAAQRFVLDRKGVKRQGQRLHDHLFSAH